MEPILYGLRISHAQERILSAHRPYPQHSTAQFVSLTSTSTTILPPTGTSSTPNRLFRSFLKGQKSYTWQTLAITPLEFRS